MKYINVTEGEIESNIETGGKGDLWTECTTPMIVEIVTGMLV